MSRMSLTEALHRADAFSNLGRPVPPTARMRWLHRLELALTAPLFRRQIRFNAAAADALHRLREGMDSPATTNTARAEFVQHHEGIAALRRDMVELQQQLADTQRRAAQLESIQRQGQAQIDVFLNSVRRSLPAAPTAADLAAQPKAWNHLYNAFEDLYRGSVEDIRDRLLPYLGELPPIPDALVLDIGSGRGEWLQLLSEKGIAAYGIDNNIDVVERAAASGLDVRPAEALEHLRALPERSLAAVTAFHLAEHLPLDVLIELIDLALRALRPGGRLILETPNPENLVVGACNFYLDPTHLAPLPPHLLHFLVTSRGFADVEVRPLHRNPPPLSAAAETDDALGPVIALLNQHLGAAEDYAVFATRV